MSYPRPAWIWWSRGDDEDMVLGFLHRADRDAFQRGKPGPFKRVLRTMPISLEASLIKIITSKGRGVER